MPNSKADSERGFILLTQLRHHGMRVKESQPHHGKLKRASVFVLITNDRKILLTKRAQHLRSHPGEVCFPGGKQDPEDNQDDVVTALRETKEEVGLELNKNDKVIMELLCRLRTLESINHLCVTPIVAFVHQSSDEISSRFKLNSDEVEVAFFVPIEYFWTATPDEQYDIDWSGETFVFRRYHYYCQEEINKNEKFFKITGLTAHIAHEVASIVHDNEIATSRCTNGDGPWSGYLWRLQDENISRKSYWSKKYFVLSGSALHQYDDKKQANRKSQTANKKNRLHMGDDVQVFDLEVPSTPANRNDEKHAFRLEVLDGQIVWKLAAHTPIEKQQWKERLLGQQPQINGGI